MTRRPASTRRSSIHRGATSGALATLIVALGWIASAHAEEPPAADFDAKAEQHSKFWERVVHPNGDLYDTRLRYVERVLATKNQVDLRNAVDRLAEVIAGDPARAEGYYFLGRVHEQLGNWSECVSAYREAQARDANLGDPLNAATTIDLRAGTCASRAGDHAAALELYVRVARRASSPAPVLYQRMGESYMALGRLDEAIEVLGRALAALPSSVEVIYSLAVALDRAEMGAASRESLAAALRLDSSLSRVQAPELPYAPASDLHYYIGLAAQAASKPELAIFHFRNFLFEEPKSVWASRVRAHLEALRSLPPLEGRLFITASSAVDAGQVVRAIEAAWPSLEACVAGQPGLLLSLKITAVSDIDTTRSRLRSGVSAQVQRYFDVSAENAAEAAACAERVGQAIKLPMAAGAGARYLTVTLPLIAP